MIAIYCRQSIKKENSISIETQEEKCRKYLLNCNDVDDSEEIVVYFDEGYSGKNTDRPSLKKLMNDVRLGADISRIIVYKLDRISRSLQDFIRIIDFLKEHNVIFTELSGGFSTDSPTSIMTMTMLAVFAQFERETIQARVKDAYHSRVDSGIYMGGPIPFGFDRNNNCYINNVKTVCYQPNNQAEVVKKIFDMYAQPTVSYGKIAKELNESQMFNVHGKPWERARIADIIKNPTYVKLNDNVYDYLESLGVIMPLRDKSQDGKGCYLYSSNKQSKRRNNITGCKLVVAPHEGLIDGDLWLKCNIKSRNQKKLYEDSKPKNTWLHGLIKCGECGKALVYKHYKSINRNYFLCTNKMSSGECDGPGVLIAEDIENAVFKAIFEHLQALSFSKIEGINSEETQNKLKELNDEILIHKETLENYTDSLGYAKDNATKSKIFERIDKENTIIETLYKKINNLKTLTNAKEKFAMGDVFKNWNKLSLEQQHKFVFLLINKISVINSNMIQIDWKI